MAQIIGTSGAWQEVEDRLRAYEVLAQTPDEIPSALAQLRGGYGPAMARIRQEIHARNRRLWTSPNFHIAEIGVRQGKMRELRPVGADLTRKWTAISV